MKQVIPYNKRIDFKEHIHEITTISLEHELNIKDNEITGDFILSGEYRINEISANKEKFLHRLPFSVDFMNNIKKDTVEFSITNFEYELEDTFLVANIEASLDYEEEIVEFSSEDEIPIIEERIEDEIVLEKAEEVPPRKDLDVESIKESILEKSDTDDVFVAYHIHIVREEETLEKIALEYNTSVAEIQELNKIDTITLGTKLIIPGSHE